MCPLCIGSAFLALTGASSAGGLVLIAARVVGAGGPARRVEDSGNPELHTGHGSPAEEPRTPDEGSKLH
jgi:hypothetical protein